MVRPEVAFISMFVVIVIVALCLWPSTPDKVEFISSVNGQRISVKKSQVVIVYEDNVKPGETVMTLENGNTYAVKSGYVETLKKLGQ